MSNPAWPSTLPDPLARNPAFAPAFDNIRKSPMESGAIKRRPRATFVPETFTGSILVDATQYATLRDFVNTTLDFTGAFDWKDWRTGTTQTYAFLTLPTYTHEAAGYWVASFELIEA
jgi:hypothetical protein